MTFSSEHCRLKSDVCLRHPETPDRKVPSGVTGSTYPRSAEEKRRKFSMKGSMSNVKSKSKLTRRQSEGGKYNQASTSCTRWLLRFPISTIIGVNAIPSPNFFSGFCKPFPRSVWVLASVFGLVALLTLTLLAIPTVAVCALPPMIFAFRWLFVRRITGFSTVTCSKGLAESGGERSICKFCSGEETSRGELEGCEDRAEAAVTRGCLRERERSIDAGWSVDADADLGLGIISHSGSWDST